MAKKLFRVILLLVIVTLLVVGNISCTYFSPLVGKWQDSESSNIIEFTRDGNVVLNSNGELTSGTYQLISSDVVKLNFEGLSGDMASAFGVDTWQYTISGNTMTVVAGGSTDVFNRFGVSTTSTNQALINPNKSASLTITYPNGGEIWSVGQTVTIKWKSSNLSKNTPVLILLNLNGASEVDNLEINEVANTGSYQWTIPPTIMNHTVVGSQLRVELKANGGAVGLILTTMSANNFTISSN
jgi:Ser-Thr-rich glycosyl-phosphatidyl-inositol-anchored membrane family